MTYKGYFSKKAR